MISKQLSEPGHGEAQAFSQAVFNATTSELTQKLLLQEKTLVKRLSQQPHDQLGPQISLAIRQVRQVLVGLRPPLLEELGLAPALDNELRNRALSRPNLDIAFYEQPELAQARYPPDVEYAAFMVMREALENALKHAGASAISVRLSGTPALMHLVVSDNGCGLASEPAPPMGQLGILGMHERAHAVGARVILAPVVPHGTQVAFVWQPPIDGISL